MSHKNCQSKTLDRYSPSAFYFFLDYGKIRLYKIVTEGEKWIHYNHPKCLKWWDRSTRSGCINNETTIYGLLALYLEEYEKRIINWRDLVKLLWHYRRILQCLSAETELKGHLQNREDGKPYCSTASLALFRSKSHNGIRMRIFFTWRNSFTSFYQITISSD